MSLTPIYLDNAATSPVRPEVLDAMMPYLTGETFGNPSSVHGVGRAARAGLEAARGQIAHAVGAQVNEVYFTSGGTEANNLAVLGAAQRAHKLNKPFRVAVGATEHKSVLGAAHAVARLGGEEIIVGVDQTGRVRRDDLEQALERGVSVISIMAVNNETGILHDVRDIAARCMRAGVPLHCDAVQAMGKIPFTLRDWPCAILTLSGHKLGAAKGIGVLVLRDRAILEATIHGGSQQHGIRPGTENVSGAVGMGRAVELAVSELADVPKHVAALRDAFESRIRDVISDVVVHGAVVPRGPHISCMSFPGTSSESMMTQLDLGGVACSTGAACTSGAVEPSHVLDAMDVPRELAVAGMRFSFGHQNTEDEVERAVIAVQVARKKAKRLSGVLGRV